MLFEESEKIMRENSEMLEKEKERRRQVVEYPEFEKGTTFKERHLSKKIAVVELASKIQTYLRKEGETN